MPQVFQVLKCYKCLVFQVHQTKKSNKFQCKMCGEKQSIKRHYGLGNGQECRKHVQKLNGIRGELDEAQNILSGDDGIEEQNNLHSSSESLDVECQKRNSKWSSYINNDVLIDTSNTNETMYLNDTEVVLELPKKSYKTLGKNNKNQMLKTSFKTGCSENQALRNHFECIENNNFKSVSMNHRLDTSNISLKHDKSLLENNPSITIPTSKYNNMSNTRTEKCEPYLEENNFPSYPLDSDIDSIEKPLNEGKKYIPHKINKNSKWAKFVEVDNEESESRIENICLTTSSGAVSDNKNNIQCNKEIIGNSEENIKTMFSMCDDSEIDDYLTI